VAGDLALTVQNLSPLRQRLDLGHGWQLLGRIDGLDRPLTQAPDHPVDGLPRCGDQAPHGVQSGADAQAPEELDHLAEAAVVRPWQLASYRIRRQA
jgi:hypothetical protein